MSDVNKQLVRLEVMARLDSLATDDRAYAASQAARVTEGAPVRPSLRRTR